MPEDQRLSYDAFLALAEAVGVDVSGRHGEELFPIVQNVLSGLDALRDIDTAGAEPDMAFVVESKDASAERGQDSAGS